MGHIAILEAPQHMNDGVHFADIGEELVAQTFALGSAPHQPGRSEEHTSELQSLMRISYAVFCLKKKTHRWTNKINRKNTHLNTTNIRTYNLRPSSTRTHEY